MKSTFAQALVGESAVLRGIPQVATRGHSDYTAAAWVLLKPGRHRETMTASVKTPTQTPADAAPDSPHAGRRRVASGAMVALAGACSLVLLNAIPVGPARVHWAASLVALAAALALLVAGKLGWEQTVANAQAAGLVAPCARCASYSAGCSSGSLACGSSWAQVQLISVSRVTTGHSRPAANML